MTPEPEVTAPFCEGQHAYWLTYGHRVRVEKVDPQLREPRYFIVNDDPDQEDIGEGMRWVYQDELTALAPEKRPQMVRLTRVQPGWPAGTDHPVVGWDKMAHPMIARHHTDRSKAPLVLLSYEWVPSPDHRAQLLMTASEITRRIRAANPSAPVPPLQAPQPCRPSPSQPSECGSGPVFEDGPDFDPMHPPIDLLKRPDRGRWWSRRLRPPAPPDDGPQPSSPVNPGQPSERGGRK